ncbi:FdhF/YdeP family oxidoreductase [Granulosicoccus sp.]|nr:FdhF/YdeP family oxidoreductase [Granulosicoccus sp.]
MRDKHKEQTPDTPHYDHPSGGWGSLKGMLSALVTTKPEPAVINTLLRMNKPGGHMCTSCAWTKPPNPGAIEICENGAKATLWDLTSDRCTPEFFREHSVSSLLAWSDHDLELAGRLTHPLRYNVSTDHYEVCTWEEAFAAIGDTLLQLDPQSVCFYASGRASLETSYLWALYARVYGHNNLADSSNMCHETTSVALSRLIGSPVGTCTLGDFNSCDLLLFFGQNTGTNSPRFLNTLQAASERGCKIVTFNPVRERGLIEFASPQSPVEMLTPSSTKLSDHYLQVKAGGDIAVLAGLCKTVLAEQEMQGNVIDEAFINDNTQGFDELVDTLHSIEWSEIETVSGLPRTDLEVVGKLYVQAERTIGVYGMGLTQHVNGFQSIAMLVNLLLLKGNFGQKGAGICPVRGHSNVQGQRTVGISEKPELVPLDRLKELFEFEPPRTKGRTTVEVVQGVVDGSVKGFVSLGGNFARAIPDQDKTDPAWSSLSINVQIATKLNRSHLLPCANSWLLPCLVRAEEDMQASGAQAVSMEDSMSCIHGSIGKRAPASDMLKSELEIVAGMAKATLTAHPKLTWDDWVADYSLVRDLIESTYPDDFANFNGRLFKPGGFYRHNPVRERRWMTVSGYAQFTSPNVLSALVAPLGEGEYTLITLRSNDQFNTTIYGFSDRLRGLQGDRNIVLMNSEDISDAGLVENEKVRLQCALDTSIHRELGGLKLIAYDLPRGCIGAYYPETNLLIPLDQYELESKTPAYKGTPVKVYSDIEA